MRKGDNVVLHRHVSPPLDTCS